jgi:high-affinity iron transporter
LKGGGGWGIFNAILGWQNSATYGSVISYNVYWIAVIIGFLLLRYKETTDHLPFMKSKAGKRSEHVSDEVSPRSSVFESKEAEKNVHAANTQSARTVSD